MDKFISGLKGVAKGDLQSVAGPEVGLDADSIQSTATAITPVAKDILLGNSKYKKFGPRKVRSPLLNIKMQKFANR